MAKRSTSPTSNYYGDFLAVEGVTMTIKARSVTAFIGPSGCGKSTMLRSLNRMHEVIPGARVEGKVMVDGQSLYGADVDPVAVRRSIGMVFQRPNPFPTMSIYDNVLAGSRLNSRKLSKSKADEIVERSRKAVKPLDRGQGPARQARPGSLRRPAAATVHRPRDRRRARGAADGRALLGAGPDLDVGHRGPHLRARSPTTRSSSSPTICSRRPASPTRPASST